MAGEWQSQDFGLLQQAPLLHVALSLGMGMELLLLSFYSNVHWPGGQGPSSQSGTSEPISSMSWGCCSRPHPHPVTLTSAPRPAVLLQGRDDSPCCCHGGKQLLVPQASFIHLGSRVPRRPSIA